MLPVFRKEFKPAYRSFWDDDFFRTPGLRKSEPAVNISSDDKKYTLELAVPGMKKKDLKIEVENDVLSISTESKEEKRDSQEGYSRMEFNYTSFSKCFGVPEDVDSEKISAEYKDGILYVELPKMEEQTKLNKVIDVL